MIKEAEFVQALAKYVEHDLLPSMPDQKMKAAAVAFIAAATMRPEFVLRISKNVFPQIGYIVENGNVDIESLGVIAKEYMKHAKTVSVNIPMLSTINLDASDIEKIYSYAKGYEAHAE